MSNRTQKGANKRSWIKLLVLGVLACAAIAIILGVPYVIHLDKQVRAKFEGQRWELPARVYSRALDLFPSRSISADNLEKELQLLRYLKVKQPRRPGEYARLKNALVVVTRGFNFPDERTSPRAIRVGFSQGSISSLKDLESGKELSLQRLDPVLIANIYPSHNEDRVLVRRDHVPEFLIQTLLAVEDKAFYEHQGVRPKAILRALVANIRAGRTVQGGSTLTQQLVKNFFLTDERSLVRKGNEAIMSLLLEWHYDKEEILEAYLNEIYLGQDGARAVHGFGLASQYYFQRNLEDLQPEQIALLVAIVKGASWYEPRKHPERALQRRNLVLDALVVEGLLEQEESDSLKSKPLGVTERIPSGSTQFPAFLELVRQQLKRDYRDEDLQSEGLVIFTTLDPQIQLQAERSVVDKLGRIEKDYGLDADTLEASMVIASVEQGEVLAVVGGREVRFAGFNRALAMKRQIGSLVKPAVYLTALARPGQYNLATLLDDSLLEYEQYNGEIWSPKNYDGEDHGQVMLMNALVNSYNVSTARLGINLGLENVVHTLQALGVEKDIPAYPSLVLGALELSPLEVAQMYQIIAANGYRTTLRAILSVIDQQGETLQRYPLAVQQVVPPEANFLITTALQEVARTGTARSLQRVLPPNLDVAGKTGTTNDLRDSWFAGFSGEHVGVAWVGRDDYEPTRLSGATGALPLWADVFGKIGTQPLIAVEPDELEWHQVNREDGVVLAQNCSGGEWLPFLPGSVHQPMFDCRPDAENPEFDVQAPASAQQPTQRAPSRGEGMNWFERLFNAGE